MFGGLALLLPVGGLSGPVLSTQVMKFFGPGSLYYFVALVYLFMALFTLYRMSVRAPITAGEQSHGMAVILQTSQVIVAEAMYETTQNPLSFLRQDHQPTRPLRRRPRRSVHYRHFVHKEHKMGVHQICHIQVLKRNRSATMGSQIDDETVILL